MDERTAEQLRREARRHRRMADEIAGYPSFEGQGEHVRGHRAEAHYLYDEARRRERPSKTPRTPPPRRPEPATPAAAPSFSATRALRNAGVKAGRKSVSGGDRVARTVTRRASSAASSTASTGGELVLYVFGSILLLALLSNALGGRGPAGVAKLLGLFGGAIGKLASATDPIISKGTLPSSSASSSPSPAPAPAVAGVPGTARQEPNPRPTIPTH